MRRRFTALSAAAVLAATPALTSCGIFGGDAGVKVTVKGAFGARPDVSFPKGKPGKNLAIKTLERGKGTSAHKGDLVVADYVGYRWGAGGYKLLVSSYNAGQPGAFPTGRLVKGLDKALDGARPGGRVVAEIPPKDGYGDKGDAQHQVNAEDSLVYVLDVRAVYPRASGATGKPQPLNDARLPKVQDAPAGQAPPITVPKAAAPKSLQVRVLVQGQGQAVRKGQLLALQYEGAFWRDGKIFNSSWADGRPYAVTIGTGQVLKGWDQGLAGQKIGSRVMLVVPPSLGYGPLGGLQQAGIKKDDTLVFVVDILGAH